MSSGLSQLSESTLASPTIKKKGIKKRLVKLFSRSEGNLKEKYHTASDGDNCFAEDVSMSTVEEGHLVKKGRSSWSEKRGKKERSDAENERQGWGHSLPRLRYHRAEDSMSRSSKRASKTRSLSSSEMNLPAPGFLQRFGSLTWRKKKPSVLDGSGLASPESTLVDTHWSLGQLNRPVDSVSDLKDERPKSCYVEALFTESALESSDFCPKDNQNIQKNLEISATFDCLADSTVSYCSSEEDAGDKITQLQSFMSSNEKEENEQAVLPFWAQSILNEYMPQYHKPQPSPVLKKQEEGEEDKCLHGELTYNTSQVTMTEEQINSAPHSPSQSEKSLEPYQYSQTHPKCPSSENEEQDTSQLNPPYPAVQEEALAQNVTESQATPGPHKVRYEIIITMKKEGQMDETDVPELGGTMSIGEELVGPDLNLSPSLECQACGHHRAGTTALTAHAHTEQPKNYTNLEDEKISELKRGGETCVRAHLDRDISLAGDEQQDLLVCEQTPEHYRSQSPNMEKKCSLDNEHSHSPGRAQPSRMVLSNNEVSRVPTNRDRNSYVGHVMDMRKVFESNGSKEDFIHNLKSVKPNSYSSVRENKYTVTQNELGDLHKPIYSQVFKPPKPSLDRKGCNELFPHLARKDSVNAAQAWESSKEMNSRSVLEKDMIHLRDRDVKVKETKHKHTILPLKDLHVHPRTPTPPPDKSRTMSVFLTSPKGWRKESLRSQSPRPLHEQTDGNMDCAKPVLNEIPDKFTFTYNKDGYQNYVTDSFSAKTVEKASRKVYKGTAKEINNNVLIPNPHITSKEQSENSYKMTILQDESDLNNIGESSTTDMTSEVMTTDRNLTLESNTLTAIYKLSERQLRDTGTRDEVMLKLAEKERPMQDPAIISWEQTESPDDQSIFTKSNTIIRGESDDYYEQSNFFGTVESHITENYKVMDNPVTSDNMINMNYLTSEQPIFLDYTIPFVTTNVYKGATQDASQHCHIAESNTESVTSRNYINPPGEIITGTAVSGNTFGKTQTRSFIWDFPEYSGQWPTSMVLKNIHTDYMIDNSYNGWHKAKAQMVYTSTEDESEQKEQDKPISEVLTKAGNIIISHPEVKGYRTVNKTEQSSESGENRNQANDGIAADKIGLDLGSTNQQKADNECTKQEHTKQSYDSGIQEGDLQVVVQHSVCLSEDKARISNASQNVDKTFFVVTNDKPVCTILPVGNDIENVPCLTQDALVPSKETSQKQATIQQKELTHIHHDGIIDINPVNKEIYNHMKDEEKTHQARELLFHILSKEISVEHVYDFREKDLEKCMANDNIDIIDLAPSMEDQADNMSDLLDVHQAGDMLIYLDTKEALVEQDNDQADFLQKPEELVGQTYDAIDIVTCVTQNSLVFAPSNEECLQQATSQPSKKFIHLHTIVEKDIMSEKEDQADSNINMNDEDKTHRASELLFHIPSKEISVEHAYDQGEKILEKIDVANDNIDIIYITPTVENETENMSGSLAVGEADDVLGYTYTKEASVEQDNHQAITDRLQKFEQLVDQTDNATDILTLKKETDENISKGEGDDKTDQMFDYICSACVSEEHAFIQSKDYLIQKPKDVIDSPVIVIDERLEENQVENMRGSLAVDVAGDVLVYISTKEASVEQYNHKAITDRLQKLEQLVDQTDNATDILTLTKKTDENIRWEVDDNKDQMFDYICSVDVSEEHGFIQSKEYLIQKPMDVIDPNVNVIDECLEENPEETDSGLEDEDTVDIQSYRLMTGKSVENTNEKPSSEKPVVQENHYASLTDSSSKDIQAEHIINLTAEDIKGHSNNSQNVIFFASFNEASVEHNKYKPVAINQGENVLNQSNGIISILPTDEQHREITGKQVDFITMEPKVERHSENSLLANKNDIQAIVDKYRSDYVTDDRNLLIQEAQKVENRNPTSSTGFHSHSGQISSEISSKVCQESVQDTDTQASGHSIIEDKECPDVLEPSMQKVLTHLSEQSVQLVQGSHVSNTVNVRNDITTEYTGDQYNLQIEEDSSKDMEMWINTLRHLESHSGQISSEINSKVCQESVQDADTQTTDQSNIEDKGSPDVLEPSVQKVLTNLSEQSVQREQGSQTYNTVHVSNDITTEYTGDRYNLQIQEQSSKDMEMWINTLRHLESHSGKISSEINSKVCQKSVPDADTQTTGPLNTEDKGSTDVLEPSVQKLLTNLSEQSVQLEQGSQTYNTVHVSNDITTEYTGDRYNLQIQEESSKDMEMWINTIRQLESHSGKISSEINSKVCQESVPDADTQTAGQLNTEDKGSTDVLEPSVQKLLTNVSEQSVQLEQGSQTYNTVHVSNDITTEYTGDRYNLQIQEESSKDMEMWINTLRHLESHSGKISSEINSKVCQESVPDADTQTTGQSNTEDKGSTDVLEPSVQKLLTNLSEQSVKLVQGSQAYNMVHVRNDITTEYTGDRYNLQIEEESSKDMEMWINTLQHLESHSGQISSEINSKVCQKSVPDADTQTTGQLNTEDKGSTDVIEPSVQKLLTNLSEQSVQLEQGSQTYNTVHVSNDITTEYTGDRYNLQIEEESSKDMEMWINTLRHLESHSGKISSEINSKVCQESVPDADTQTTGQSNTEDKGSTDVLEPSVQKLLTNLSEQSVKLVQGSQAYNMVHVRNDITTEYTGDRYNLQIEEESSKDMEMWINTLQHLESHSEQISSEINSKVCQENVQDADTQTTDQSNIVDKGSPDVLEPSVQKVLTNLSEQSVQLEQGSQTYNTVHVRNDITTEYTGDQYNLQIEEESSKDMAMWINTLRHLEIPEFMKYQRVPRQPRHSALSMYATLPPIKEDVCSPNSDHIDSDSLPQMKNDDLGISQDTKPILNLEHNEKKYSWEKDFEKPIQISPLEMMRKHSGEEVERTTSHKSSLTQNLSQRQGSIIGSLLLSERQERKNEQNEGKSFSRLKSSLLLSSYIKPKKEPLSVNGEEEETLSDSVHTEAGSTQPNVVVPRIPESPKHPVTGTDTPPKHTVNSVPPLVSKELPCKSNLRIVSQFKASTDIWHHTKKEHGKVNPRPGKVLLFSDLGFNGRCYEIYGNVSDTSEWELQETISIRVIRGGWILYEEPRFHGRRVMLLEGDAELKCPWLEHTDSNREPQTTSAFWVGSLRHVVRDFRVPKISLFLQPNGEGEKVQIEGAAPDMSEYGGTIKTESIIVHCGMWLVFSKPLYQGDPYILEPGGYPNRRSWGAEDPQVCSLEAARIGGPIVEKPNEPKLLLFQMPEFEGTCLEVTRDMNSIQGEHNLQGEKLYSVGSLKVVGGCWVGYEKEGFRGHQYLLEEGDYNDFSDWGGCTEELGSVRLIRTDFSQPEIVLYELPGCLEGPCLRLSESLADLEEAQYGTRTGSIHVLSGVWVAYENVDFSGEQYILEKGVYHNYQDWGAENGKISSVQPVIQVGGNSLHFLAKIHMFSEPNFYGDCLTCIGGHMELPESFSLQSCRVECGSWSLYEGENQSGEQYMLSEGEYPTRTAMGCLTPCPLRSLKMVPLYFSIPSLSLHGLERFEGKELDFTEEVRSLQGEGYNNHVMSVSVKSGIWVVYEHSDFRGRQWLLECKQIPNWLLYSGLQRIGSLCPIRQRTVYFRLRNRNLGLFLCVAELTEDMKAARVLVTEPQDGRCLLWYYEEGRLKNQMAPHMNLQVIGQSSSGTKVVLWSESRKPIQTWILEDSGCITSCLFKGMCLDVKGGQCYDSDHVIIWETTEDRLTQQWDLEVF